MAFSLPKPISLIIWFVATMILGGYLSWVFVGKEDKTELLPGITTNGHHQIEQRCDVCHDREETKGIFTSSGVSNKACMSCHGDDLEMANDSHPVAKFRNPENATLLKHIDAMQCVTCHTEHLEDHTHEMAVSIPPDYCAHCHESTLTTRESHKGLAFNTCETSGCHNYHDNTTLYESFLLENADQENVLTSATRPTSPEVYRWIAGNDKRSPAIVADAPPSILADYKGHVKDWIQTSHAMAGINCSDCHGGNDSSEWQTRPAPSACTSCHDIEAKDFQAGKHGMRIAVNLAPMELEMARLEMKPNIAHKQLDCASCHGEHEFDRTFAAAEACIRCHDDEHTKNYENSTHFALWRSELGGDAPVGSGVSCATCHLPTEERRDDTTGDSHFVVQHNQNANLRPNEKMYQGVCMNCHGLEFTMDALASRDLIDKNFSGLPNTKVESVAWAVEGEKRRKDTRRKIQEKRDLKSE